MEYFGDSFGGNIDNDVDSFNIDMGDYFDKFDELLDTGTAEPENRQSAGDKCNNCGKFAFIEDHQQGFYVCTNCGSFGDSLLDTNPEWKTYDDSNKTVGRCGKSVNKLLPKSSIGTQVNAYGRIKMLHGWNSMPYKERSLNNVFKLLREKCRKNNIPKKIEDDALIMYKIISERKHKSGKNKGKYIITRGINRRSIIASSLFHACRRNGMTRSPKEIAQMFNITETELNKGAKNFVKLIKMQFHDKNMGTSRPIDFVRRKCDDLSIKSKYTVQAISIAENIDRLNIASTHTSCSLAAASILLMANINKISSITIKVLADAFGLSEATVIKTHKNISHYKNILTNEKKVREIMDKMSNDKSVHTISKELYERMKKFGVNTDKYEVEDTISTDSMSTKKAKKVKPKPKKKINEIVLVEDSPESIDYSEYDQSDHEMTLSNSIDVLKGCTIATENYMEILDDIEDELDFASIIDEDVEKFKEHIMG